MNCILMFGNEFTAYHWIGTILVFIGSLLYSEIPTVFSKVKELEDEKLDQSKKSIFI